VKRLWPHVRAALVLFHVAMIFVIAFPAPVGGMDRANWKVPSVQQDFAAWAAILHVTPEWLEETIYVIAVGWMKAREYAVRPFGTYLQLSGCDQPWRMFVAPVRVIAKFQVQLKARGAPGDTWETLFEEGSARYRWRGEMFAQERLRSQMARWWWPGYQGPYAESCAYFARLVFKERQEAEQVRCRYWIAPSLTPEEAKAGVQPEGQFTEPIVQVRPPP